MRDGMSGMFLAQPTITVTTSSETSAVDPNSTDVVLVGAGIMSATLGVLLKELQPDLTIEIFETLDGVALESSDA